MNKPHGSSMQALSSLQRLSQIRSARLSTNSRAPGGAPTRGSSVGSQTSRRLKSNGGFVTCRTARGMRAERQVVVNAEETCIASEAGSFSRGEDHASLTVTSRDDCCLPPPVGLLPDSDMST